MYLHICMYVRDYRTKFQNKKKNLTQKAKFFLGECQCEDKVARIMEEGFGKIL